MTTLLKEISNPKSRVFRKLKIKRRLSSTGLFETNSLDITDKVIKWGKVNRAIDPIKPFNLTFQNVKIKVDNSNGDFNPESDGSSLWFGFASQQRTLVTIEAGFFAQTLTSGVYTNQELPGAISWDSGYLWDTTTSQWGAESFIFTGIMTGDMPLTDTNDVSLNIKPLLEIFRQFPAEQLTTISGRDTLTASDYIGLIRDFTDGAGSYIFRPFFGDTTSNWVVTDTTKTYPQLNTTGAKDIRDKTLFDVLERLAESENFIIFVDRNGKFNFRSRDVTTTVSYEFFGSGKFDNFFGNTIKKISKFGPRYNRFYSRVQVKYNEEDTSTSISTREATMTVSPINAAWNLGIRTLQIDNSWIANAVTAAEIADELFEEFSVVKKEIEFTTSLVPHLEILDRVQISYDSQAAPSSKSIWDARSWSPASSEEFFWDDTRGNAIQLNAEEFKFLSISIDLDKLECKFVGRIL